MSLLSIQKENTFTKYLENPSQVIDGAQEEEENRRRRNWPKCRWNINLRRSTRNWSASNLADSSLCKNCVRHAETWQQKRLQIPQRSCSVQAKLALRQVKKKTVMLCCRKASCAMSSRKSAQRHGKVLQDRGLRSPLCCLADKWQMNGLTSCFLKGTCGPPSLPRGLPQRWLRNELFAKNGADCRPSTVDGHQD